MIIRYLVTSPILYIAYLIMIYLEIGYIGLIGMILVLILVGINFFLI